MKLFVTVSLVTLLLILTGCIKEELSSDIDEAYVANNIDTVLKSDDTIYKKGDNITILVTFRNNGTKLVKIKNIDINLNISFLVNSSAEFINLRQIHSYDQGMNIRAGRYITEKIRWNQVYLKNRRQYIAESGIYILRADVKLTLDNRKSNNTFVSSFVTDPLMITIED